jgi:alkylhydroperoxidase/carboxymuconolactone decarboxylase family protein YurZ
MLPKKQLEAFGAFYDSARHNDILEPKTTYLIHLAAAIAVGCGPCMEYYLGQKEKEGITDDEIGAVLASVMTVSAGRAKAQLQEAEKRRKEK